MSTETKTDREMLAEVIDGPAFEDHPIEDRSQAAALQWSVRRHKATKAADAILASDWFKDVKAANRLLGAVRISGDYDEAKAWDEGWNAAIVAESPVPNPYRDDVETSAE